MITWRSPCDNNDAYHSFADGTKRELALRRGFLFAGIGLTLFGCVMAALSIALPSWQVAELAEFNAVHEHGIFYDCVRSDIVSLERVRAAARLRQLQSTASSFTISQHATVSGSSEEYSDYSATTIASAHHHHSRNDAPHRRHPGGSVGTAAPLPAAVTAPLDAAQQHIATVEEATAGVERCVSKFENGAESATWTMRMAVEEGDPQAREMLLHRFLPQHKAIIFFFVFSLIFSLISVAVGACSNCFVPNGVLHVISAAMAMCCSVLGDAIFFVASTRLNNRNIHGATHIYYQHLSYGFCIHVLASAALVVATLCATVAAYILVRRECAANGRRKRFCNADMSSESLDGDGGATSSGLALCCCGSGDDGNGGGGVGTFGRHLRKRKHVPYTCADATAAYEAISAAANPSLMAAAGSSAGANFYGGGGSARMSVASGCDFSTYSGGGVAAVAVSPFPQTLNFYGNPSTAKTLGIQNCCQLPPTSPLSLPSSPYNIVGIPAPPRDIIPSTVATGGVGGAPLQYSLFRGALSTAPHYHLHYFDQQQQNAAMIAQQQQQQQPPLSTTVVTTAVFQQQRSPSPQSVQSVQLRIAVPIGGNAQTENLIDGKSGGAAPTVLVDNV